SSASGAWPPWRSRFRWSRCWRRSGWCGASRARATMGTTDEPPRALVGTPMLSLDVQLRRGRFERRVVIEEAARGVALVGPSGAGSTAVLKAIAGVARPRAGGIVAAGRVLFDGVRGVALPVHRRRVGYVFQDARLFPHLDVRGNLLYGRHGATAEGPGFELD